MRNIAFLLIIIVNGSVFSQTIEVQANTAKDVSYLNEKEKQVIFFHNIARLDGTYFIEKYLDPFMEKTNDYAKNADYFSLIKELKKVKNFAVLMPAEDLSTMAKEHAVKSGKIGHVGHQGYDARATKYGSEYSYTSENCDYGVDDPLEIVIDLLIDEGISGKGHRKNILNPESNYIGVGYAPHKIYAVNVVCDFGKK